ncbi:MAG: ComEC/Rec2 family competence protein [Sediminibacterium sp.]|jgi:competence protein ComEC|nr:MAG: ComEC/Rec2 family competence protein [Sediminibacterium sp.]
MEKSPKHFRAAHPLLFIASILLVGLVFAKLFLQSLFILSIQGAFGLLFLSLILLQFIIAHSTIRPLAKYIEGISVYLLLFSWGILLFFLTKEKNTFQIPYPKIFIDYCRNRVINKLNASISSKEANAFAQSLLLGVKTDTNKELLNAYKQLGIIHIVAISGMHLEIIFKNILHITRWLPRKKLFMVLELFIVLSSVWTYTLMAFASPSIVRAAVFFSIYYLGKFLEASSFTLNVIAGGILILLLFDLKNIENIGLQLSYAAVLGIHLLYPLLSKMLPMDNPILVFLWNNLCISIAAQLTTLPILLYHFHQLASLVLISNFIMVPLSTLLLYAIALLVITPNIMGLPKIIGQIIEKYIIGINNTITHLDALSINRPLLISFGLGQVILFYLALLLIYAWLYTKRSQWLLYLTGLFCCYFIIKLFSLP